jgi:hypothetical protein
MKYTIADILHLAADKHLASKDGEWLVNGNKEKFSCCAMSEAVWKLWHEDKIESEVERDDLINRCSDGLKAMGCPVNSVDAFNDGSKFNAENQQARYAWLKFAAIIAEEQGV